MAGINVSIGVTDNATPALRKMAAAVENLENVLNSVDSRFRNAFDTSSIKAVEQALAKEVQLTDSQRTSIEKLNNQIERSQKKRIALEQELKGYGQIMIVRSKAVADANAKLNLLEKQRNELVARVAHRKHKILGLEKAIGAAKKDENVSAYQLADMELLRSKWVAAVERGEARIKKYKREISAAELDVVAAKKLGEDVAKRKLVIADETKYALANEAHWENQIAAIKRKAATDQEALAKRQADSVIKARQKLKIAEEEKNKAIQKEFSAQQKIIQQEHNKYVLESAVAATTKRYSESLSIINDKYKAANNLVSKLKSTIDVNNKAEVKQLRAAESLRNVQQNILNLTRSLITARANLAVLQTQGNTKSLQFLRAKQAERSITQQIAREASKVRDLELQTLPAINANTAAQKRHNDAIKQGTSNANMLWSKIKSIGGAYLGVQTAGTILKTADSLAANDARLALMVKDGETVQGLSDQIYAAAMRSRVGYLDMADAVAKVGIQAGNLFSNSGEMVRFMETFNKMGVISKATTQQTNAAMTQLIQALSFGQLRGDELKSILENMPMVAHALADELTRTGQTLNGLPDKLRRIAADGEVTADEIRELGYEGQLSAETVVNAMLNGAKKIDDMANNMTWTWVQVWTVFKNSALRAFTPVLNGISKIIQTERFKRFATWVDNVVNKVATTIKSLWIILGPVFGAIFDAVAKVGDVISNNWSWIAPIVAGVVGAFIAYKAALMAVATWTAICTAANTAMTISKVIGVFATKGITKATSRWAKMQLGLNASLFACPITWIILAIIALIVILYVVIALVNKFAGTSISATGIICAVFTALGVHIWNVIAYVWNIISSFIEFFVNVWSEPMYSIKKFWVNLATNVLDSLIAMTKGCDEFATKFANAILSAINTVLDGWNWFVDKLGVVGEKMGLGRATHFEYTTSITSDLESFRGQLDALVADKPEGYWEAPRMQQMDVLGTANRAYDWGKGVSSKVESVFRGGNDNENKVGDFTKALTRMFNPQGDPETRNTLNEMRNNTDDIAKNTGSTASNTERSDEYFKYLRQAADRNSMNRNQLMNFKVDMSNVNHIRSGLDADEIMRRLARELYHEIVGKLDGAEAY